MFPTYKITTENCQKVKNIRRKEEEKMRHQKIDTLYREGDFTKHPVAHSFTQIAKQQ